MAVVSGEGSAAAGFSHSGKNAPMFIDSHCHLDRLDLKSYAGDLDMALEAARAAGVRRFLTVSVDLETFPVLRSLAERHADVYASVGVHPSEELPAESEPTASSPLASPGWITITTLSTRLPSSGVLQRILKPAAAPASR